MLIVCSKEGFLCNRLFHFSHLVSFALENNEIIWYPYIYEYSNIFKNLRSDQLKNNKIFIYSNPLLEFILRALRWLLIRIPNNKYIIHDESEVDVDLTLYRPRNGGMLFLSGWLLRDYESLRKQQELIKSILKFDEAVVTYCDKNINKIRRFNIVLIGMHIRRGDYKKFLGGKYFYSINVYKEKMQQLRDMFGKEKTVHFLVCTNDKDIFNLNLINELDVTLNQGNEQSDLYSLSQCDFIVGPPSTFSSWASFYGKVPLLYVKHENQILQRSDFEIAEG